VALIGSVLGGVGNGIEAVAVRTTLQERVEERLMAVLMSLNEALFQALPGPGILLGGAIGAVAGPRAAFAAGGVGALAIAVVAPRALRGLGTPPEATVPQAEMRREVGSPG
jgi:MFS family permease